MESLPPSWVDRIFTRLQGLFGSLWVDRWKTGEVRRLPGGCSVDVGMLNAKATWAIELAGFATQPEIIARALQGCATAQYPPTLPEFLRLCREEAHRAERAAHRVEDRPDAAQRQRQREAATRIASLVHHRAYGADPLAWARRPASQTAMNAIWREVRQHDNRVLGAILEQHLATGICSNAGRLLKRWDGEKWVNP